MGFGNDNNTMFSMPVAPAYGGYGNGFGNGLGGDGWWILILLLAFAGGGWGLNGMNGGAGFPLMAMNTNNDVQRGFDQSAVMSGINSLNTNVQTGFAGVNQNLCNSTASLTQAVNNGFATAEIANNGRQMADMNQNFAMQTAITGGLTNLSAQLAQCCCDNRLATANLTSTILAENCADRTALADASRDIIASQNAGFQKILDTMCQNQINDLQRQLTQKDTEITMLNLKAQNLANTDAIIANNDAQTALLRQYYQNGGYSCNGCCA